MTEITGNEFDDVPFDADPDAPTHEPVPADCQAEPPTDDGLNHMGYFRRPAGDDQPPGSTIVIKSHATADNLANHEREGVMTFLGYAPN